MSFDPFSGAPQRPRSTPIPDPDQPGQVSVAQSSGAADGTVIGIH